MDYKVRTVKDKLYGMHYNLEIKLFHFFSLKKVGAENTAILILTA